MVMNNFNINIQTKQRQSNLQNFIKHLVNPQYIINLQISKMSKLSSRTTTTLPNISSTPNLSYAQRYEHMTKLANYGQLSEAQIWKQYEKLRTCLKQINKEVLYHMEKKAYTNLSKEKPKLHNRDSEGTLMLLEDQKRTNQLRYANFYNELSRNEERLHYLSSKKGYLQTLNIQGEQIEQKIKRVRQQNKDMKRKAKIVGKNIVNCSSALDKLVNEQDKLHRANIRYKKFKQHIETLHEKNERFSQRIIQTQQAIDTRLQQFSSQENFIQEQIHYERYQELNKMKEALGKYEPIYKRNYLMKLKELEQVVNSVQKHEKIIGDNEGHINNMRGQIEMISKLVTRPPQKKRSTSSVLQMSMNSARISSKENNRTRISSKGNLDVTVSTEQKTGKFTGRRGRMSSMNDKNENVSSVSSYMHMQEIDETSKPTKGKQVVEEPKPELDVVGQDQPKGLAKDAKVVTNK